LILAAAIQETRGWFGTAIPQSFWDQLAEGLPPSGRALAAHAFCRPPSKLQYLLSEFRALRRPTDKLHFLYRQVFPSYEAMARQYGFRSRLWLPFYHLRRFGTGLVKALRRKKSALALLPPASATAAGH
jgi:hypothetical protein